MSQQKSHNIIRVPAIGSPFEVANNTSRTPQTLNYVDCYPVKEEQFGEKPLYQVAMREAFKQLSTYDLGTITTAGTPFNSAIAAAPPANLSGYIISQIGQMLVVNEDASGTALYVTVLMTKQANASPYNTVAVSLEIDVSGTSGTVISLVKPLYLFFGAPALGCATMGTFSVPASGPTITSNDPYYLILGPLPQFTLTISSNQISGYNIYTNAVSAGMTPGAPAQINVTINGAVSVSNLQTGTGWATGSIINIINNGNILGSGGSGGLPGSAGISAAGGNGSPGLYLNWNVSITNSGIISGGGGGGGAGQEYLGTYPTTGGGGAGYPAGSGWSGSPAGLTTGGNGQSASGSLGGTGGNTYLVAGTQGADYNFNVGGNGGGAGGGGGPASPGGRGGNSGTGPIYYGAPGGAAGNAVQCNGYSVLNIPNGSYSGAGTYGTIYGVIG